MVAHQIRTDQLANLLGDLLFVKADGGQLKNSRQSLHQMLFGDTAAFCQQFPDALSALFMLCA